MEKKISFQGKPNIGWIVHFYLVNWIFVRRSETAPARLNGALKPYRGRHTSESKLTLLHYDCCVFSGGGVLAQAHHVLRVDPEVVLVAHYQLIDSDARAVVVLHTRVPLL